MFYSQLLVFTEIFSTYNFKVVLLLLTKTMLKSYLSGDFAGQHQPLLTSIEKNGQDTFYVSQKKVIQVWNEVRVSK